ncbi:outer dense fiber protein 3 isoform X2 [Monodelphis domestica]|uniref:outer dense fiber protein 3 isoform X2 n=1 Tax=Monodelphis domestica TaxID=13616 RepID=UPI0024E2074D|nr:outer dense fiber protein 3 isoform X2 [Monodelphis domestica]
MTSEEVWVGSWRPHHPRGPIMALYTSPGPKYMIPGTTGFVKHTPTKLRAPAFSFRGAPMVLAENYSPGPRYSVNPKMLRTGKDTGPAYSILGRYQTKTITTPGPVLSREVHQVHIQLVAQPLHLGQDQVLPRGQHPRSSRVHAADGDGAAHGGQSVAALLLHQGPEQAGQLQQRPSQDPGPCRLPPDGHPGGQVQGPAVHHGRPDRGRGRQDLEAGPGRA